MPIAKFASKGAIVKSGAAASPSTVLGQVRSVKYSPGLRALVDSTCHDNTVTKSYVDSGLRDTPDLDMTIALDPADAAHEAVRAAHAAGTVWYLTLILPDAGAATIALTGIILDASIPQISTDGLLEQSIQFKATAVETFTP